MERTKRHNEVRRAVSLNLFNTTLGYMYIYIYIVELVDYHRVGLYK